MSETATLLIVDPRQDNQCAIESALSAHLAGIRVLRAGSARAALALAAAEPLDGALVDLHMRDLDGIEVCRRFKENARSRGIPVLLLTSRRTPPEVRSRALDAGADGLLDCPCDDVELVAQVRVILRLGRAEAELRRANRKLSHLLGESEARFEVLFAATPLPITATDLTGRVVAANAQTAAIHGLPDAEQAIGMSALEMIAPECHQRAIAGMEQTLREGGIVTEHTLLRADGSRFPGRITAALVRDAADRPTSFIAVTEDLTESIRAERNRDLSARLLERLHQPDSVEGTVGEVLELIRELGEFEAVGLRLREGEEFPYYNSRGCARSFIEVERHLCAQPREGEMVRTGDGRPVLECLCGTVLSGTTDPTLPCFTDHGSFWTNSLGDLLGSSWSQRLGTRIRGRCAAEGYESVALIPLRADGETLGLLQLLDGQRGLFTEAQIRFFEGMAASIGVALERERSWALEQQLLQSQKMESIGRLAGGIAHDFNNLLSVVLSHCGLAIDEMDLCHPLADHIEAIREAGTRAATLTDQLLTFSRQQPRRPGIVDVGESVRSMQAMLGRLIGEDVHISVETEAIPGAVEVDPGQLEQVILNLAVNARDAMPTGGDLSIRTEAVEVGPDQADALVPVKPGSYVRLSVADTGIGMARATLQRAIEPFFTTKAEGAGTGLGLSTAYGIVRQSDGYLRIDSEPGEGSTFEVYLPRTDRRPQRRPARSVPVTEVSGAETVLLVEDEAMISEAVGRILRRSGYRVLSAVDGYQASEISESHDGPIPLLITDVVMPGMNGREVAEQLVRDRPEMRVLFTTGYTADAMLRHGIAEGEVALLRKPFDPPALLAAVRRVLDGRGPRDSARGGGEE